MRASGELRYNLPILLQAGAMIVTVASFKGGVIYRQEWDSSSHQASNQSNPQNL
jgi:hypothetical protein